MRERLSPRAHPDFADQAGATRRGRQRVSEYSKTYGKPAAQAVGGLLRRAAWTVLTKPKQTFTTLLLGGISVAVAVNALSLQTASHPAPLFSEKPTARADVPVTAPIPAASAGISVPQSVPSGQQATRMPPVSTSDLPARQQLERLAISETGQVVMPVSTASTITSVRTDPIAALIRNHPASLDPETRKSIMDGQKALDKLGYGPLAIDGVLGPGTRRAIEAFETDRRLPVTGEFGPRTMKALTDRLRLSVR